MGYCETSDEVRYPNPPPPSFPRGRESIPGKVRRHYPGSRLALIAAADQDPNHFGNGPDPPDRVVL